MGLIILDNFFESVKFFLILYYGFGETLREKKKWNFGVVIVLGIIYSFYKNYFSDNYMVGYEIWIIVSFICIFREKLIKTLFLALWCTIFIGICDGFTGFFFQVIFVNKTISSNNISMDIWIDLITIYLITLFYILLFQHEKAFLKKLTIRSLVNILLINFCYLFILTMVWDIFMIDKLKINYSMNIFVIYIVLVMAGYYNIILMIKYAIKNQTLKKINEKNNNLLFIQEQQYAYANQVDVETKKFRHDIKNHLLILSSLTKEKKWDEVDSYLNQMEYKISDISPDYYVNHSIADAIIRQFQVQCRDKSIQFKVKGYFPENCRIEYYDITTILTNILQNAYEAVLSEENKVIKLEFRYDERFFYIIEENTFDGNLVEKEGIFITRKNDKNTHGFGVSNIKESVKKYNGDYFYKISDKSAPNHRFQLSVVIPLKEKC